MASKLLKVARGFIDSKEWQKAKETCEEILKNDENYNALVFLALSRFNLNELSEAKRDYAKAIAFQPTQPLAHQGLVNMLEKEESWSELIPALQNLRDLYKEDGGKFHATNEKLSLALQKNKQTKDAALELEKSVKELYSESPVELSNEEAIKVLTKISHLYETWDKDFQLKEVDLRRKRLGSDPVDVIRKNVEKEATLVSNVDKVYHLLLNLSPSDSLRDKLISFLWRRLAVVGEKSDVCKNLLNQCKETNSSLALEVLTQLQDYTIESAPTELINQAASYSGTFAQVALCWKEYPPTDPMETLSCLLTKSTMLPPILALRLATRVSFDAMEYENAVAYATQAQQALTSLTKHAYAPPPDPFPNIKLELDLLTAQCYNQMDPKLYRNEALNLFKKVLQRDPKQPQALLQLGILLSKSYEKHEEALTTFDKLLALPISPELNQEAREEKATVLVHLGKNQEAHEILQQVIEEQEANPEAFSPSRRAETRWRLGKTTQDLEEAFQHYLTAAKLDPSFAPAFSSLGDYYRSKDDHVRAEKCFTKALALDPMCSQEAARHICDYAMEQGDLDRVKLVCESVTSHNKRAGWAWKALGLVELDQGRYSEAVLALQMALRLDSNSDELWNSLGLAYKQEGKFTASVKAFARSRELNPDNDLAKWNLAMVKQDLGWWEEAIVEFESLQTSSGRWAGLATCHYRVAKEALGMGAFGRALENFELALECCKQGIAMEPEFQTWYKITSQVASSLVELPKECEELEKPNLPQVNVPLLSKLPEISGNVRMSWLEVARRALFKCIQLALSGPKVGQGRLLVASYMYDLTVVYHNAQIISHKDENREAAMETIQMALNLHSGSDLYWNAFGLLTKDAELAQHAFIKSLECNPTNSVQAWTNLGYLYHGHKDNDLAFKAFSEAQKVDPEAPEPILGKALLTDENKELALHAWDLSGGILPESNYLFALVQMEGLKDNWIDVMFALKRLVHANPQDASAWNMLGLCLERQDYQGAINAFDRALDLDKDHEAQILINRARSQCANGDYSKAVEGLKKAMTMLPSSQVTKDVLILLGVCQYFAKDLESALKSFEQAQAKVEGDEKKEISRLIVQILYAFKTPGHLALAEKLLRQQTNHLPSLLALGTLGAVTKKQDISKDVLRLLEDEQGDQVERVKLLVMKSLGQSVKQTLIDATTNQPTLQQWRRLAMETWKDDLDAVNQSWSTELSAQGLLAMEDKRALVLFERFTHREPWKVEAWVGLYLCLMSLEKVDKLHRVTKQVSNLDSSLGKVLTCQALILQAMNGDADATSQAFELAEEIAGEEGRWEALGYLLMGRCLVLADDYEQAIAAYKQCLEVDEEMELAWWELAHVYALDQRPDASLLLLSKAPPSAFTKLLMAKIAFEFGKDEQAGQFAGELGGWTPARLLQAWSMRNDTARSNKILSKLDLSADILAQFATK